MAQNGPSRGLAREAIGLREVLFQSITHMAPAAAVAFSIIVGANFAGGALPLSVVLALVGCLLVAVSIGQLSNTLRKRSTLQVGKLVGLPTRPSGNFTSRRLAMPYGSS